MSVARCWHRGNGERKRLKSDHRPILLCPFYQVSSSNVKPFRFIFAWLTHASFNP
ncbi:hypothetical protein LINPERHAP1_LOCUS22888, partial [Linum perenne]